MLLGQTVHKIKSMLFLVVKQDSCLALAQLGLRKKNGGRLCERRGP